METMSFLMLIYVFVLAIFVGFELITKVPPTFILLLCPDQMQFPESL